MRLGPYEVTAWLGSGGMAEVYRARDVRLGREVAIKILPEDLSRDPASLARFEREARTASALNHPHLVTIYDIGETCLGQRRVHYMAMELIRGETLRDRLCKESRDVLLRHIANIADGLAKAHAAGVIHRDLKPENVMISDDDYAKVVDFGLAKHMPRLDGSAPDHRLTAEGFCVGTLGYMAPEQVRGRPDLDARVDIFALGCILYEAIAKENPFDGESPVDSMHHILYKEPPPLPDDTIDRIVRKCIAKNRERRYASMRDLAADLRSAIGTPVTASMRPPAIRSIAVLPFHTAGGNEELQFLGDGIPEDVVRNLGRVRSLRVIASSSTSRFRDIDDPRRVGGELGVEAVLVGKLRAISGTVFIDAELVNVADGTALWGRRYRRDLTDVVQLEQEIARDVCDGVRIELAPQEKPAQHHEAYDEYLRGKREMAREMEPGFTKAIEHFRRAIEIDPDYAAAYAALGHVYGRRAMLGLGPAPDSAMQMVALAEKALALDESLPEAHFVLAVAARLRADRAELEHRLARTIALNPSFAQAYAERAVSLAIAGRLEEADAAYRQARALDPLSPRVMTSYGATLSGVRQFDRALTILNHAAALFPDFGIVHGYIAVISSAAGRHAEALAALERTPVDSNPNALIWKGIVLARVGRTEEARAIADRIDELARTRYILTYWHAKLHFLLGDREVALALLEKGIRQGDWLYDFLPTDASYDVLRDDPHFQAVIELVKETRKLPRG